VKDRSKSGHDMSGQHKVRSRSSQGQVIVSAGQVRSGKVQVKVMLKSDQSQFKVVLRSGKGKVRTRTG